MRTYAPKPRDIERRWYVIDASGVVLGRLASQVANVLRGKHKPIYAPHADTGDHVIVINARGIRLTGGKENKKVAYRHSGYPGGLTETGYARLLAERPVYVVEKAVRGMLPKNSLGRAMARKLQVYEGAEHPHQAQRPVALRLGETPAWAGLPKREARVPEQASAATPRTRSGSSTAARAAVTAATTKAPARKRATAKATGAKPKPKPKATTARRPASKRSTAGRRTPAGGEGKTPRAPKHDEAEE